MRQRLTSLEVVHLSRKEEYKYITRPLDLQRPDLMVLDVLILQIA